MVSTSGAFLFTLNPAATASSAHTVSLGGFDGGIGLGSAASEYVFAVVNPTYAATTPTLAVTVASPLTSQGALVKSGRGTLILSGVNTAGGGAFPTVLNEGTLEIASLSAIGGDVGDLVFAGGALRLPAGFAQSVINRPVSILAGGATIENATNVTLSRGLGAGIGGFTKRGNGVLTLDAAATYLGPTSILGGTVVTSVRHAIPDGTLLTVGGGTSPATVNFVDVDVTLSGLEARANSTTASVINVSPGRTLRVNGDLGLTGSASGAVTLLTLTGGGSLIVQGDDIYLSDVASGAVRATLDLTGLASADLDAGRIVIARRSDNQANARSILRLSDGANTLTTGQLMVGASAAGAGKDATLQQTLFLGAGTNVIRATEVNLGVADRDSGLIAFAGASGTVSFRDRTGTGRTNFTLGPTGAFGTAYTTNNVVDLSGHEADVAIDTYATSLGAKTAANTNDLLFSAGTLDILNLNMAFAKGTGASLNRVIISGGNVKLGGSAAFGDAGTGSLVLATAGEGQLNINGGSVDVGAALRRAGAGVASVTLNGGSLDLNGFAVGDATNTITFNAQAGTLRDVGTLNGTGGLTKTTTGTLLLDTANSFAGGVTIDPTGGTIIVGHSNALSAGLVTLNQDGVLELINGITLNNAFVATAQGNAKTIRLQTGAAAATYAGNITNNEEVSNNFDLSAGAGGTLIVSGIISSGDPAAGFEKIGAGAVILSGANTYTGTTTVTDGTLQVGAGGTTGVLGSGPVVNNATLVVDRSDALTVANLISGSGALIKAGAGNLTLSGVNTFTGVATVSAGTLTVGHVAALGTSAGGVTVSAGAGGASTLRLQGGITVAGESLHLEATAAAAGNAALSNASGDNTWSGNLTVDTGSHVTYRTRLTSEAGLLNITGAITFTGTGTRALVIGGAGAGVIGGQVTGSLPLVKDGVGTWTVSGDNSSAFTGILTVGNGTLQVASESNLGAVPASFVAGQLTLGAASTQGILQTTGTTSLSANRGVTLAAGGGAFDVAASTTLTIASAVTGTGALTKSGAGLLDIKMGVPQYGGTTTINGGTLRFTNVADVAAVSTMVFNINNGSTLEFQSSVGGNNRTVLNNKTFTFGASGGGTIRFNGGNHLMQTGVHTFVTTGGSKNTISQTNGGYINNQSTGNTVFNVADGTDAVDLELSAQWANGTLTKAGLGVMAITGVHTGNLDLDIDAGVLEIGGSASLNGGTFTAAITNDGTFRYGSSAAQTMSGIISGTGAVTMGGSGNLTLSGANTFTGATLVSGGTLTAASGALATTSGITVNGATLAAADYNLAATLALDATATATISGESLTITGAVTNAGTTDDALNFSASTGKLTLTSLAGAGKTRFGSDADVLGGVSEGTVTVVGALGANITGGTVSTGSLAGAVSGGNVTVTNLLTGGVSAGTVNAGSLTGDITGGAVTVTGALTGNVTAGTVTAGSMTGNVGSSVTVTGLLNGEITSGTNSLGSLTSASVTGGTNTITGAATVTTVNGGATTVGGVATITTLTTGTLTFDGASGSIGTLTAGTFNLNGAAATVGTLSAGTINLAAATALTVDSGTFSGSLAGSGSLIKATTGILTLTGANLSFSGATTINAGELIIQDAGALGSGAVTVATGATLNLNSLGVSNAITVAAGATITGGPDVAATPTTGNATVTTVLTGAGGLEKTDGGELTLTTPNFFTGAVEANVAGAVIKAAFLSDTSSSLGASALDNPANLVLGSGATLEFTGAADAVTSRSFTLDGTAGIAATGSGALVFTADSKIALVGAEPLLTLSASNAGTNIFRASLTDADILAGNGIKNLTIDGTGTWVIGGAANRFKNDVRLEAAAGATIGLESGALPDGATIAVANGTTLRWEGGNTNDLSSKLAIAAGATAKLDLGSNNVTFAAVPTLGSGASLEKQGTGTLNISAAFSAPTLNVAVSSGTLAVNGVLGDITLTSGARLGGTGTLGTATVGTGAILAPGNSPGTLNATDLVLTGGSVFEWEVQDATSSTGYDKINLTGNLDLLGANPGSKVSFKIISRLGAGDGNTAGDPLNFGPPNGTSSIRTFNFGVVGGVLLNNGQNISDVFEFDLTEFTYSDGSASNAGLWSIAWDGGSAITLTAVPEPSTYGFGLGALALAAAAIRRRRKQQAKPAA